ncbi:MAG: aspartate carbamoyltransferase regulatory subunit, partial [Candidatus Diapherotrites archaeon]
MTKEIRITPIKNGTAIDHLNVGSAYKILEVLNLKDYTVTIGINVE